MPIPLRLYISIICMVDQGWLVGWFLFNVCGARATHVPLKDSETEHKTGRAELPVCA